MDPTLALIAGAVGSLAGSVASGAASAAGKSIWEKITGLLTISKESSPVEAEEATKTAVAGDSQLAIQILSLIKSEPNSPASQLVGNITAEKVLVAYNIEGDVHF